MVLGGHSRGGGEIQRYGARPGPRRIAKAVLVGAVPPVMVRTRSNPNGLALAVFDGIRQGTRDNRTQFFQDLTMPFYGYNRKGAAVSEGVRASFWAQGMSGGIKGQYDCIYEFSEVDFTEDLKKIDVPTLIIHGDDDQIVPIGTSAMLSATLIAGAVLKVYPGAPHGLPTTHQDQFNADLLTFCRS